MGRESQLGDLMHYHRDLLGIERTVTEIRIECTVTGIRNSPEFLVSPEFLASLRFEGCRIASL